MRKTYGTYLTVMHRVPPEVIELISRSTDKLLLCVDLENVLSRMYSLYDGKYIHAPGMLPLSEDKKIMSFDLIELACLFIDDVIDWCYYTRSVLGKKYNIDIKIIFFCNIGQSGYHLSIDPDYKIGRRIGFYSIDDPVYAYNCVLTNNAKRLAFKLMNELFVYIPNITMVLLDRWESDIIPYIVDSETTWPILTISNDADMLQLVSPKHLVLRRLRMKTVTKNVLVSIENVAEHMFKGLSSQYDEHKKKIVPFYTLFKSIMGDPGDSVIGIKGYGPVKTFKWLVNQVDKGLKPEDCIDFDRLAKYLTEAFNDEQVSQILSNMCLVDFRFIGEALKKSSQGPIIRQRLQQIIDHADYIEVSSIFKELGHFNAFYQLRGLFQC